MSDSFICKAKDMNDMRSVVYVNLFGNTDETDNRQNKSYIIFSPNGVISSVGLVVVTGVILLEGWVLWIQSKFGFNYDNLAKSLFNAKYIHILMGITVIDVVAV